MLIKTEIKNIKYKYIKKHMLSFTSLYNKDILSQINLITLNNPNVDMHLEVYNKSIKFQNIKIQKILMKDLSEYMKFKFILNELDIHLYENIINLFAHKTQYGKNLSIKLELIKSLPEKALEQ